MGNRINDTIRPTALQSFRVSARSQATWNALLSSAKARIHLPQPCLNVQGLLSGTPSIPQSHHVTEFSGSDSLFLEGFSTWALFRDEKPLIHACDLEPTKSSLPRKVCIGNGSPRACNFSDDFCPDWPGFQSESGSGNYLSLLVLGWSYVFSARLIELRRQTTGDKVSYTGNMAQLAPASSNREMGALGLEICTSDFEEVRWWASILANGSGWQATLFRNNQTYFSPWEIHLNEGTFTLYHTTKAPTSASICEPPSSAQAQHYLFNLARQLNVLDQLIGALAGTLTLPTHNRFGAPVTLPRPILRPPLSQKTERAHQNDLPAVAEISHYMALSSISGLLASCLFGALWEPGVSCNLVSEWLNPAFEEILPFIKQPHGSFYVLWAMCERTPNAAPIWLGAAITGLLPRIFQVAQSFIPTSYPEAAVWSRSPQSFMDPSNHHLIPIHRNAGHEEISREDEFRLLFLTDYTSDNFGNPPISPYPPFGRVNIKDTSLEVRLHLSCNHRLAYQSWNWRCQDGQVMSDFGKCSKPKASGPIYDINALPLTCVALGITCAGLAKKQFNGFRSMGDWVSYKQNSSYPESIPRFPDNI